MRILPLPLAAAVLMGALPVIVGCATTGNHVTDWGEITVSPGDTGSCMSNPCRVFLRMPPGDGTYTVTANEIKVGDFPAGRTVSLGSFFESNAVKFPGADIPNTYVYVPASGGDGVP